MTDQATELRQRMRRFAADQATALRQPHVLAVLGARPAVGATSLAVNLAIELTRQGHATALIDADPSGGAVVAQCRAVESAPYNLANVLTARATIHAALYRGPVGLQIVAGVGPALTSGDWTDVTSERLYAAVRQLGGHAKIVLLDAGSSAAPVALRNCRYVNHVLLVATPDETALMETYATLKLLHNERPMLPVSLVVSQAADDDVAHTIHRRLGETSRRFLSRDIELAAIVPEDVSVADAIAAGTPLALQSPRSAATRAIERLAATLMQQPQFNRIEPATAASEVDSPAHIPAERCA